jgi:hypothetical protein
MTIAKGERMLASDITDLTFFPVGSILMMDGNWTDGRGGWYICDGRSTPYGATPNLTDKFLRGGATAGGTGGSDKMTLQKSHLPPHSHVVTLHYLGYDRGGAGAFTWSNPSQGTGEMPMGTNSVGEGQSFDIVPSYYAVIYIKKMA